MARSIAVGLGIMEFPFDTTAGFWRWVDLCEAGGINSLWQTDRLISRAPILESMSALAAIAGRTRRIKFGVNVVSVAMREPVLLAKQCATIDMLSGGRLLPGFGIGSPRGPEWQALHLDAYDARPQDRRGAGDHWPALGGESVDFEGRHFRLTGARSLRAGAAGSADVDRRFVGRGGAADGAVWYRLAGGGRDAGGGGRGHRGDPRGGWWRPGGPSTTIITGPRLPTASAPGTIRAWAGGGGVSRAHRARSARGVRGGRRDDDLTRLRNTWTPGASKFILRPAAQGDDDAGPDAAADRRGAAVGRGALATTIKGGGIRRTVGPLPSR